MANAKTERERIAALARVASGAATAAGGASTAASKAERSAEEAKKVSEETKKVVDNLKAASPENLNALLNDPAKLGALISTVSGGAVPATVATMGVQAATNALSETMANGNTKESQISRVKDKDGNVVQENVDSVIRNKSGDVISTAVSIRGRLQKAVFSV